MAESTENLTLKLLQEMRAEMTGLRTEVREGFQEVNTRIDAVTHVMMLLAGRSHDHEDRLDNLETSLTKLKAK